MGKIAEKKKKKGRPFLLDLQKRNLNQHQDQLKLNNHCNSTNHSTATHNSSTPNPLRRSTRPNPNIDEITSDNDQDEDDNQEHESIGVLSSYQNNSSSSDSNHKKRKISGSGFCVTQEGQEPIVDANTIHGAGIDTAHSPLPDKKLLLFMLDRLQKKDTRGVFSEAVDPEELPDYHDIVKQPMDFGTVRKKLACGAYAALEQFEKDVFLISSNAMEYNAPDTIYFRQARAIHELAKKSFEHLREATDNNELEPKIVRRGRPPTKHLKKPLGRPSLERVASGLASDPTLATGLGNTISSNHDLRKRTSLPDKSGIAHDPWNKKIYSGRLAGIKFENNDESRGSILKGNSLKHGKTPFLLEENRRDTYKQSQQLAGEWEPSFITTYRERKQLMAVGLFSEYGFARSLSCFAATLGPIAWSIAAKKIEKSLPASVKFGPGWIGDDACHQSSHVALSPLSDRLLKPLTFSLAGNLQSPLSQCSPQTKADNVCNNVKGANSSERVVPSPSASDAHSNMPPQLYTSNGLNSGSGFSIVNRNVGSIRSLCGPAIQSGMNGTNGFTLPGQLVKLCDAGRSVQVNLQSSQVIDPLSRTDTDSVHLPNIHNLNSRDSIDEANTNTIFSGHSIPNSLCKSKATMSKSFFQKKPDIVPSNLNVRFQSPRSQDSSPVGPIQPDLALQL